jgi:hypothetical protein
MTDGIRVHETHTAAFLGQLGGELGTVLQGAKPPPREDDDGSDDSWAA